jgi:hypothetical protein
MNDPINSATEKLLNAGWQLVETNPFREKVSKNADKYFTYTSALGHQLGICVFASQKLLKIRLADATQQKLNWFQSEFGNNLNDLVLTLMDRQDEADAHRYFGFYSALAGVCSTSILAWEQWESNYR